MPRVNIVKQVKLDGRWQLKSIPRKHGGAYDWNALPEGRYYVEWYEHGKRLRQSAGKTVAEALEIRRRKRHELEGRKLGVPGYESVQERPAKQSLRVLIDDYLEQARALKKPNTHRKYQAVLERFSTHFPGRRLDSISVEELNNYVMELKKEHRLSANTVLHNMIIIAQLFRRYCRGGITRELQLPERVISLPREYSEEELEKFLGACDAWERVLFVTFLLTGLREQEVMYLFWTDINVQQRTIRVTAKPELGFYPKRWEEREVPIPTQLVEILEEHPESDGSPFVFPSPTGNREQHMLEKCKQVAEKSGLNAKKFDLKTFRSTYATRMLRAGLRCANGTALDGTQVARDDDAIPRPSVRCAHEVGSSFVPRGQSDLGSRAKSDNPSISIAKREALTEPERDPLRSALGLGTEMMSQHWHMAAESG